MKKTFQLKNLLVSLAIAGSAALTVAPATVQAGASANVAVGSNYIWRGVTQNDNNAAVSGGLDYSMDSGLYVGTWASSLSGTDTNGYEADFYAGFGGDMSGIEYDLGYIYYAYPIADNIDFSEVYGSVGFSGLTAGLSYQVSGSGDKINNLYYFGSYGYDFSDTVSLGLTLGSYDMEDKNSTDYSHGQISLDVSDITFAIDQNFDKAAGGVNEDKPVVTISYSKSFDL